jgi:hypothetical protein
MSRNASTLAVILLIGVAWLSGFVAADRTQGEDSHGNGKDTANAPVIVHGCHYEDSCSIDYTHRGVWVITPQVP